jgi:hypothetical protein
VRGRSRTLKVNYRTSHQIRCQADRLLPPEVVDVDHNTETRTGTVSVFNGPEPQIATFADEMAETVEQKKVIKGTRWLLLKNPENLDATRNERQRLDEALRLNQPRVTRAFPSRRSWAAFSRG